MQNGKPQLKIVRRACLNAMPHSSYPMPTLTRRHSLNTTSNQSSVGQQADSSRLYLIINIRSGWKDRVKSRYGIHDSSGSLEHLPSLPLSLVLCLSPLDQWTGIPMSPIHKESEMTLPKYPATPTITQPPKITRALFRLLPYNQPSQKEIISPQRPLLPCDGEWEGDEESKI